MIYAVVNTKGGVSKTTTACHLACMLARNARTLLIDGDEQKSAASWAMWRREAGREPSPTTTCLTGKSIVQEGRNLATGFDHTVIDVGGRDSAGLRSALLLAQRAIVPIGASSLDAAALTDLLTIVDMAKDYNPDLRVDVLLTRLDPRTRDTAEMANFLSEQQLQVLASRISERVAFRRAISEGLIVSEMASKDPAAIAEMENFFAEITK